MGHGPQWLHDRRFMIRKIRKFGMGKSHLEDAINIEAQALVEDIKKYEGKPIQYPPSLRIVALNVIWQMIAGSCCVTSGRSSCIIAGQVRVV